MQILLGHTKIESTVRSQGVDVEDAPFGGGDGGLMTRGNGRLRLRNAHVRNGWETYERVPLDV